MFSRRPQPDVTDFDRTHSGYALRADDGWMEPPPPPRDFKKILLILGLGALSWVATYVGMLELIQANMGSLSLPTQVIIGFSVAMLMTMIIWLLDQMFAPLPFLTKLTYVAGYVFLTMISVGFGFGFYWKVLESRSEASRSAESAVTQVQSSLVAAASRLDQLQTTLTDLTKLSAAKAIEERERGTSCPNSQPGDGPRRRLRDNDAARFSYASNFVKGRLTKIKAELSGLDGALLKITSNDRSTIDPKTGTRNAFMRSLSHKLELTTSRFNAFASDPQLRQIRTDLDKRASTTIFPTGRNGRTFSCPDPQLQAALRGVVTAIDQLPQLQKPYIATVEGSEAVIEAFRRLGATFQGALLFKLPPSADEMRELQKKAVRRAENTGSAQPVVTTLQGGLAKRDYIPLAIALFVDVCLLLVSIGRPMNRMDGLIPRMRMAESGPVYQILSRFSEIHGDEEVRKKFEVFRHVVFDFNGDYYVAVPLDAPRRKSPEEVVRLQQEAHLLANLFASFEKEKIFARVINPLLSTRTIQRKLRRQGSDFADAQAFRIYRFKDGAWSEIILGAIMGASRRARAERRAKLAEDGHILSTPAAADRPASDDQDVGDQDSDRPDSNLQDSRLQDTGRRPFEHPIADVFAESVAEARSSLGQSAAATPPLRARQADDRPIPVDRAHAQRFGPYAASAAREQQEALQDLDDVVVPESEPKTAADAETPPTGQTEPRRRERIADRLRRIREANTPPEEADVTIHQAHAAAPSTVDNVVHINPHRTQSSSDAFSEQSAMSIETTPAHDRMSEIVSPPPIDHRADRAEVRITETRRTVDVSLPRPETVTPPALPRTELIETSANDVTVGDIDVENPNDMPHSGLTGTLAEVRQSKAPPSLRDAEVTIPTDRADDEPAEGDGSLFQRLAPARPPTPNKG
ncbi:MAG: hypothetical protein AAF732_09745 [Pseudomonadota bacterium]